MSTDVLDGVDLTEGGVFKPLMVLSAPIVLSQLMQVGYNLIDTFWVGRLGADAVSTISFAWPIVFMLISLASGFTVAGTTLVSQNEGASVPLGSVVSVSPGESALFRGPLCGKLRLIVP